MSPSPMAWSGAWLEALVSPAIALDDQGAILELNDSARRLLQGAVADDDLDGRSLADVALAPASRSAFARALERSAEGERWGGSLRFRRGHGEQVVRARVSPVRADDRYVGSLLTLDTSPEADPAHLAERMTRLARVATELQSTDDLEQLVEVIVTHLADAAGATSASVSLRVDEERLAMLGFRGGSAAANRWGLYAAAGTPAGTVLESREPLFFADRAALVDRYPALADDDSVQGSILVLPLHIGLRGVGVVTLAFPTYRRIDTTELDFYKVMADGCAQALERIRALDKVAEQNAKLRFLAEASAELARSLDYEQTLARVAELAVPGFADWCAISLEQDGVLRTLAVAHRDPAKVAMARELQERYPSEPHTPGGSYEVLRTGEPLLVEEIPDALLRDLAIDEQHLELLRALELRSGLTVPLKARGHAFGTLTWVNGQRGRRFDASDVAFGEDLSRRASVAIDNALLHSELRAIADSLQAAVAPDELPKLEGWELAASYTSAGRVDVGGDFYDVTELPDGRLAMVIGDVMGRGVDAAASMSQVRAALRAIIAVDPDPQKVLSRLDLLFERFPTEQLVSLAYVVLDPAHDELRLASAGHPAPLRRSAEGELQFLEGGRGTILGVGPAERSVQRTVFGVGDTLLLFTDGLLERRGEDYEAGRRRLLRTCRTLPPVVTSLELETLVEQMRDPTRDDDIAVLALRRT